MPSSSLKTVFEVVLTYKDEKAAKGAARMVNGVGGSNSEVREVAK